MVGNWHGAEERKRSVRQVVQGISLARVVLVCLLLVLLLPSGSSLGDHVSDVICLGSYEKVIVVHAQHAIASVENAKTIGYRAVGEFPRYSVGILTTEHAVSVRMSVARPKPAPIGIRFGNKRVESSSSVRTGCPTILDNAGPRTKSAFSVPSDEAGLDRKMFAAVLTDEIDEYCFPGGVTALARTLFAWSRGETDWANIKDRAALVTNTFNSIRLALRHGLRSDKQGCV